MKPGASALLIRSRASRSGRVYTEDWYSGGTSGVLAPRSGGGALAAMTGSPGPDDCWRGDPTDSGAAGNPSRAALQQTFPALAAPGRTRHAGAALAALSRGERIPGQHAAAPPHAHGRCFS